MDLGVPLLCIFQFPPLREGRQGVAPLIFINVLISIPAPPRGATAKDMQFLQIFCPTLANYRALAVEPCNLQGLFW